MARFLTESMSKINVESQSERCCPSWRMAAHLTQVLAYRIKNIHTTRKNKLLPVCPAGPDRGLDRQAFEHVAPGARLLCLPRTPCGYSFLTRRTTDETKLQDNPGARSDNDEPGAR